MPHFVRLPFVLLLFHVCTPTCGAEPVAWLTVTDPDPPKTYADVPYLWIGNGPLGIEIGVPLTEDRVLEFLWGSKGDARSAAVTVRDKTVVLGEGGYDGFRWVPVPIPPTGEPKTTVKLHPGGTGAMAFIAAVRVRVKDAAEPASLPRDAAKDITIARLGGPVLGEAFPERRPFWDERRVPRPVTAEDEAVEAAFVLAEKNARAANEAFYRSNRFVHGWLAAADPKTGLIPRNLNADRDIWNAQDAAADNYPFMVLTCAMTDRELFEGHMHDMLETEIELTSRVGRLPDTYSFSKEGFQSDEVNMESIIFGGSEYVKDGLLAVSEWLGPSPWSERMIGIVDDVFAHALLDTPYGRIPSRNVEVNGEMLQALSRLYWLTGEEKYLDWAVRIGDYYLLGDNHPARGTSLRLRDHGCEILDGMGELYVTLHFSRPEKKEQYNKLIHELYDCVLALGRNEHGLLYNVINPREGTHDAGLCDTWGYNYYGIYSVYLVDKTPEYLEAVRFVLGNLPKHYMGPFNFRNSVSADEYADLTEGGINLYNRERVKGVEDWIDIQIRRMWSKQQPSGVIEGWHGDGNSARTSLMYALWKTQGLTIEPWREDVRVGAVEKDGILYISLAADESWSGKLKFDRPRHRDYFRLPIDFTRINQFPEWFTVGADEAFQVEAPEHAEESLHAGKNLHTGLEVKLEPNRELRLVVRRKER